MVVQHNLMAMNANRMLGLTTKTISGSTEKLSSGYRINRAADDAAGLAISEKMRKQVRGLTQAAANAEDGISCVQTAEGALAEVQDMLQRMNELCVQAANGTNSVSDRQYIQDELDQLVSEIDRIAETTKFNETFLLKGDQTGASSSVYITNYSITYTANIVSNEDTNKDAVKYKINYKGKNNVVMVDRKILESDKGSFLAGKVIRTGDDITDYMRAGEYEINVRNDIDLVTGATTPQWYTAGSTLVTDPVSSLTINAQTGAVMVKTGTTIYTDSAASVTLTANDIGKYYESALPSKEIYMQKNASAPSWYAIVAPSTVPKAIADPKAAVEIDSTGALAVKNVTGAVTYCKDATGILLTVADVQQIYSIADAITDKAGNTLTTADEFSKYFDQKGDYLGGLYWGTRGLTAAEALKRVKLEFTNPQNSINSKFNTNKYVAFINIELNSNVADGNNGFVSSQTTGGNTQLDLSRNGIDETVRANKDLYIYNSVNDTVVHLHPGDAMTNYLNDDNTVKKEYRLVDYISSEVGTSQHVLDQLTNGEEFVWGDEYLENASGMQKLYNSNGQVVSGIALNDYFDSNGNYRGGLFTTDQARAVDMVFANALSDEYKKLEDEGYRPTLISQYITQSSQQVPDALTFNLHVGAQSERKNKITATIDTLTSAGIGIDKLASYNIGIVDETGDNATDAIDVVGTALTMISRQRSALGAVQNRLEHTTRNLDNIVENTTAAEAAIRDTNMAEEMVRYANANILMQAGQAMLSQANQSNQGVLTLLK